MSAPGCRPVGSAAGVVGSTAGAVETRPMVVDGIGDPGAEAGCTSGPRSRARWCRSVPSGWTESAREAGGRRPRRSRRRSELGPAAFSSYGREAIGSWNRNPARWSAQPVGMREARFELQGLVPRRPSCCGRNERRNAVVREACLGGADARHVRQARRHHGSTVWRRTRGMAPRPSRSIWRSALPSGVASSTSMPSSGAMGVGPAARAAQGVP